MIHFSRLRAFLSFVAMSLSLTAIGQNRVQYSVQAGETLYHIAKSHHMNIEQVIAVNPGLSAQTLKAGSTIWLPTNTIDPQAESQGKTGMSVRRTTHIALLLPFSSNGIEGERSIEFRHGFLSATQIYNNRQQGVASCHIYDERNEAQSLSQQLQKMKNEGVSTIIGPVYPHHFQEVADFAKLHRIRLIVPFYSRVPQVSTNPYVYLVNAPQKYEEEFVADLFIKTFKSVAVAFMHVGDRDAAPFTAYLRRRLMAQGQAVTEFSAEAPLEQMRAACPAGKRTMIVPDASNQAGMIKSLAKIEGFKKYYPDRELQLFGYPDWLKVASVHTARLYAADTYIFTNSFYNPYDEETKVFCAKYKENYGRELLPVTPRMALLGHDLAEHLLAGITTYGETFSTQVTTVRQLQSRIRFEQTEKNGGFVNNSLFFIHYKPSQAIEKIISAQP